MNCSGAGLAVLTDAAAAVVIGDTGCCCDVEFIVVVLALVLFLVGFVPTAVVFAIHDRNGFTPKGGSRCVEKIS